MKNSTILLIDDDIEDFEIFCFALREIDKTINCVRAGYCEDAIDKLSSKHIHPDYIFLDLNMPKMAGKECLVHLKRMEHLKDTPVIIYSTSNRQNEKMEVFNLGANYYVHKTNTIQELIDELKMLFKK